MVNGIAIGKFEVLGFFVFVFVFFFLRQSFALVAQATRSFTMAQSWLTATSTSQVQTIFLPQPLE